MPVVAVQSSTKTAGAVTSTWSHVRQAPHDPRNSIRMPRRPLSPPLLNLGRIASQLLLGTVAVLQATYSLQTPPTHLRLRLFKTGDDGAHGAQGLLVRLYRVYAP